MNADEIRVALENAEGIPEQVMRNAVANAAEVAPAVIAVAQRMVDGCMPLPHEERLLRFGLHALGAARETSACPVFRGLLTRPTLELEWLFGEDIVVPVTQLLVSLFDGDDVAVCALAADADANEYVRAALLPALARLVWQGHASRERLLDLLDHIDREAQEPTDSYVWVGWQDAIMLLGLTDWIERVQRGWDNGRVSLSFREVDRQDWIERTRKAAADPDDAQRFADDLVVPIDDPAKSVGWSAEPPSRPGEAPSGDELAWLDVVLLRSVPGNLCLEEADGFLTALAAGPVRVPATEYLPQILQADGDSAGLDTPQHRALAADLLTRHHDAIERGLAAGNAPRPWLIDLHGEWRAVLWARGYLQGIWLRKDDWDPMVRLPHLSELLVAPLMALLPETEQGGASNLSPEQRSQLIYALPEIVLATRMHWYGGAHPLLQGPVRRTPKIGRNDPCPCGSGKKYKRCCGAVA
jgi:uncharacterized protein